MKPYVKPKYEMADVLSLYGSAYRNSRKLPLLQHKVMNAITSCRTEALGGHLDKCNGCSYTKNAYNSCRNRHCPKCQGMNQLKWVDKRVNEMLPIGYFHLVFTIPQELNGLCLMNKKQLYSILFKASSETITMLCADKKYLGAKPGIISVLHTWGQNLADHPHVHMIVTSGGLCEQTSKWIKGSKKFFLPVKVVSKVFRGKFLALLKKEYEQKTLKFLGKNKHLIAPQNFKSLLNTLYKKAWVVYAKKPFGNAANLVKYLGRYTHRVALSNDRIMSIEDQKIAFKWKDYKCKNQIKTMTLDANEFIRRFLLHTLPKGFCKIRYYGIMASKNKNKHLLQIRKLLKVSLKNHFQTPETWQQKLLRLTGFNVTKCPKCQNGTMQTIKLFEGHFASG